ncbi:DUF6993 domain-containing protein [Frigoribacterium sp. 2-23]|uniref:DUF6993 domain-containing protein n=1 Tax=Frigoribacterium sp. 2-23 TaxID=3415006 RepID=UPI003C704F14
MSSSRSMRRRRPAGAIVIVLTAALAVAGCTSSDRPEPTPSVTTPTPTSSTLTPESTTAEAFAFFDTANRALLGATPMPGGQAIVDNLVAAGFDKSKMQVTADKTSIGRDVDSVEFSVLWGSDCLIGQAQNSGYTSQTTPVLGNGACLIGTTRTIDW